MEVARLTAVIDANTAGFKRGLAGVEAQMLTTRAQMAGMDRDSGRASKGLLNLGNAGKLGMLAIGGVGTVAAGALAVGVGYGVKSLMTFDSSMSKVRAVTGAGQKDMDAFRKAAMDAGMSTKFSALEAAEAQVELGKAGMSTKDIIGGGFSAALQLAAAGEMNLADAAATTSDIMGTFGLKAKDATHIADALAQAANSTTADVSDFAMAMQMGGSAAKLAGLDMDQTVVALEALAKVGIKGSDAGTSLKSALVQIAKPTKESAEAMTANNLAFFKANGEMKDMATISAMLRKETGDMTKQQRLALFSTVAGTDGMRTLAALYASTPDQLKKYGAELQKQGTAAEQARIMNDNLSGALSTMKNSMQVVAMQVGSAFVPLLTAGAQGVTRLMQALSESGAIQAFASGVQRVTQFLGAMFSGGGGGGVIAQAGALGTTFRTIGSILSGLIGPITSVANSIRSALTAQFTALRSIAQALAPVLISAFTTVGPAVARLAVALGNIIAIAARLSAAIMGGLYRVLAAVLPPVIRALAPVFTVVFQTIANVLNMISALLEGDFVGAFSYAKAAIKAIWITLPKMLLDVLVNAVGALVSAALDLGQQIVEGIASGIVSGAGRIASAIGGALKDAILSVDIPGMSPPDHAAAEGLGKPMADGVIMGFLNGTAQLPEKMADRIKQALERAKGAVDAQKERVSSAFGSIIDVALRAFDMKTRQIVEKIKAPFVKAMKDVESEIKTRISAVTAEFDLKVSGRRATGAELTPAEAELKAMRDAYDSQERERSKAEALSALETARSEGDAKAILDAQRRYDDLLYQEKVSALEKVAEAQRAAKDKETEAAIAAIEAERQTRLEALEQERTDRLAAIQAQQDDAIAAREFERELERKRYEERLNRMLAAMTKFNGSWKGRTKELTDYLASKGLRDTFDASGEKLGNAFAAAMEGTKGRVTKAVRGLAQLVKDYLKLSSPSKLGPLSTLDRWWSPMADTLLSGVDPSMIGKVAAGIAAPPVESLAGAGRAGASSGSPATIINVTVQGTVTSERDLVDTLRSELLRTGQRNGSIFGGYA